MVYRLATASTVEEKVLHAAKQKLKLEQLVVSKGKFKDIGQKTDREDKLGETELLDLLAFDPSKTALGKANKVITDEELLEVLDRSGSTKTGKVAVAGFQPMRVDPIVRRRV
jgi:ATP-dependent DNA helicase